jgi:hypothetical protein
MGTIDPTVKAEIQREALFQMGIENGTGSFRGEQAFGFGRPGVPRGSQGGAPGYEGDGRHPPQCR